MRDQEIVSLAEAYTSIYEQEEITSEIESAAEYFCYLGLNEEGVRIVSEQLGDEEFLNFISDINENLNTEELYFNEARRGGVKIEPKTAKGKEIKGKPTAASLKRLRAKKEERRRSEESSSESKPSGMKASLSRQSAAVETAKKNQPKHRPVLDTVARGVMGLVSSAQKRSKKDVERRKEFMSAARETGKTIRKASGHLGGVAKEVGKGMSGTAKLAGHLVTKGLKERFENWLEELIEEGYDLSEYTLDEMFDFYLSEDTNLFDYIVEYLISEGHADDEEFAIEIMANMDEELISELIPMPNFGKPSPPKKPLTPLQQKFQSAGKESNLGILKSMGRSLIQGQPRPQGSTPELRRLEGERRQGLGPQQSTAAKQERLRLQTQAKLPKM